MADAGKLKRENTALLRQAMQHGSAGKNDLARLTHLSFPTVSRIVDEMVERGEAQEIGTAASTGGRCAMQYRLNPQYRLVLCLRWYSALRERCIMASSPRALATLSCGA